VKDPTQKGCSDFHLNTTFLDAVLSSWCPATGGMSNMPGCTVWSHCLNDAAAAGSPYCIKFVVFKTLCEEMDMSKCSVYFDLCRNGSIVKECSLEALPIPNMDLAYNLTHEICQMPMTGCEKCFNRDGSRIPCHILQVYSELCIAMSDMDECDDWKTMCVLSSWTLCTNSAIPRMAMYFHWWISDYILFENWVPQTTVAYVMAVIGTFLLAVLAEGVKVLRQRREANWRIELRQILNQALTEKTRMVNSDTPSLHSQPYIYSIEIQRALLKIIETFCHYICMLIAMTFNGGLFLAVILGAGAGSLLWAPLIVMEYNDAAESLNEDCH